MKQELNFETKQLTDNPISHQVYLNNTLVAEVRNIGLEDQQIIPMRELNDKEENALFSYIYKQS